MQKTSSRGENLEIIIFSVAAFLVCYLRTSIFFFLVPLQVLFIRRGARALALSSAASFAFILLLYLYTFIFETGRDAASALMMVTQLIPIFCALAGLMTVDLLPSDRLRGALRLCIGALVAGGGAILLFLSFLFLEGYPDAVLSLFTDAVQFYQVLFSNLDAETLGPFSVFLNPSSLMKTTVDVLLRTCLFWYFLILAFAWFTGGAIGFRMALPGMRKKERPRLASFRLESWYMWPLIASGAAVLLDLIVPIPAVSAAGWNVGLVVMFLFGMQGLAIVKFVLEKYGLPRFIWTIAVALLCIVVLNAINAIAYRSVDLNVILVAAIPAFGVSENWIRFRIPRDPEAEDSGKEY